MDYNDIISNTITAMLEEAAFVFSDPINSKEVDKERKENLFGFKIEFSNYASGIIAVFAEKEVATIIAANMLGCEEDDEEAEENAESALKEFTNILTGNIITSVYGTEPVIDLSLPTDIEFNEKEELSEKEIVTWMEVEGAYLMVYFIQNS